MVLRQVECRRGISLSPSLAWRYIGDFFGSWHPAIETCRRVISDGAEFREFIGVDGGRYRERLTFQSHSDRSLKYEMTSGFEGAESYIGEVCVSQAEGGAEIDWRAEIEAAPERADEIAEGTRAIIESGLRWLAMCDPAPVQTPPILPPPAPVTRRHSETRGLSWLAGPERAGETLVLFLHGIGGNATNWQDQLAALGQLAPGAALDFPGYGDSALGAAPVTLDRLFADVRAVLEAERCTRLVLVGLSLGAWVAASYAACHPETMAGLVLAGGCTGMSEASRSERAAFQAARADPLAAGKTPADFAGDVVEIIAGPKVSDATRGALLMSMSAIPSATYGAALECFCHPPGRLDFRRLSCPVLLMTGSHDRLAPPSEIRSVAERIYQAMEQPDVRFEVLPGAGHVCNLEAPRAFNQHLARFIDRVARAN